jgi:hypothetical protein
MDFAKLVSLLQSKGLHFARLDQFADPFEGSISRAEYEYWQQIALEGERDGTIPLEWRGSYFNILMGNARRARQCNYVSCWHANNDESDAMWKLYSSSGFAVAIRSSYQRLVQAIPDKEYTGCFAGEVQYSDHHHDELPRGNIFYPVMNKRRAFAHEREIRAVVWTGDPGPNGESDVAANPIGLSVGVDLSQLVESVFVSPTAPSWFADAVRGVVKVYEPELPVAHSELSRTPYI